MEHTIRSVVVEKTENGLPLVSVVVHGRQEPLHYCVPKSELGKFVDDYFKQIVTVNSVLDKLEDEDEPVPEPSPIQQPDLTVPVVPKKVEVKRGKRDDAL